MILTEKVAGSARTHTHTDAHTPVRARTHTPERACTHTRKHMCTHTHKTDKFYAGEIKNEHNK